MVFVLIPAVVVGVVWLVYEVLFNKPKVDVSARGRAVVVTGAGSGIGAATVAALRAAGAHVYACDINEAALRERYGGDSGVRCARMDVTSADSVAAFVRSVSAGGDGDGGFPAGVYALVNCAGILQGRDDGVARASIELDVEREHARVIDVNLTGTMRVCNALAEHVVAQRGVVVNIASIAGRVGGKGTLAAYGASKHGVNGYTKGLRYELNALGARAYAIEPGVIATPMTVRLISGKFDFSQTKYPKLMNADRFKKDTGSFTSNALPASAVADVIVPLIFSSKQSQPHVIVAPPLLKLFLTVLTSLPHKWQDKLVN